MSTSKSFALNKVKEGAPNEKRPSSTMEFQVYHKGKRVMTYVSNTDEKNKNKKDNKHENNRKWEYDPNKNINMIYNRFMIKNGSFMC